MALRQLGVSMRSAAFVAALIAILGLTGIDPAQAQISPPKQPSLAEHDAQYQELAQEAETFHRYGSLLKKIVKLVKPTVVHIEAKKQWTSDAGYGARRSVEEAGSGVIIRLGEKFYILTNRHVVNDASLNQVNIHLADGRQVRPTKVWSDDGTDVAVLAVSAPGLLPARLGNSDKVEIGDFVLAVGSPFGLSHSVTFGIISAKGRRDLKLGQNTVRYQDFMQTDAAINPGNSGGPLINLRGEVIGINTAIASSSGGNEGIGFTIPINMVRIVARQLVEHGKVSRAFLGVHLDPDFTPEAAAQLGLSRPAGARVTGITPNSPAEGAKLMIDDVILRFDGVRIEDDSHLVNLVSLTPIGKEITVVLFRRKKTVSIKVKVGDRSKFNASR